ncbi:hypothetical protein Patl1_32006 [Pistacia atlantica]|uniref:Uncharacterized protein n=1 Tax=Pistacia atlantica TaxID=434234 RepID=A0ACC1ARJ2_9ROSI|nr:hypothetical protein Patl1_32006 [Pistacia atlantica]
MRLILGTTTTTSSSSSSSIVAPPPHQAHHGHRTGPKPKPKSKPTPSSKHYIVKLSPYATPAPAPQTVHSSHAPLLSSLRWDYTSQLKYHADLASKLAEDGRLEEFVMILESVVVSGGSGSKFVSLLSFELVSLGIVRSLLDGRVHCVVEVLKKVEKLGIAPLKLLDGNSFQYLKKECEKIVDCGELEKFVDLIDTLAGFRIPIKELGDSYRIVKFCVDKRDTNLAIRYASILPHAHILFCTIIREFGKKRDLVSALTVYEASKKNLIGPNMYICRTIIDVCGLCCDYMQSRSIYEVLVIMVSVMPCFEMFICSFAAIEIYDFIYTLSFMQDLLSQKIAPNIYVFNSVMNVNAHDLNFTLQVYKNMQEFGVMADMTSYNILLKACCLAGRVDLAQEIYREVTHLESKGVLKLDVFTYSTIVKVFADAKLWLLALQIKEDMLSAGVTPNTVTWSSLINACANAGLVEQALCLFDEMLLAGCEPNSQCCNILLQACVEACQYDRAFRLFWSWKQSSARQTFCEDSNGDNSILSTETKHNYFVTSKQSVVSNPHHLSFSKRFPFKPTTTTYNILMKACGTDYYHAKALMDEMRTAGLSPNHISWSILIDTCGGLGNIEGAVQILNGMRKAGINPDVVAYTTAIKVCVKNKNLKLAFSLFTDMKRYQIQPNLLDPSPTPGCSWQHIIDGNFQFKFLDVFFPGSNPMITTSKELIEEWCEGVIQNNNQNQRELTSCKGTNLRSQSLLLEKLAENLQKSTAENLAIDLRGLTKVEARIVVLAVLRMIKENHSLGIPVKDDMLIILGPNKVLVNPAESNDSEVKDAITKLLQNDLGLNVSLDGPIITLDKNVDMDKPFDSDP